MSRTFLIVFLVAVLVAVTGFAVYKKTSGGPAATNSPTPSPTPSMNANTDGTETPTPGPVQTVEGGVQYQDVRVGDGEAAQNGMKVTVHYTGLLTDGTKFDSSVDRGTPFSFTLGAGEVIRGWDVGVLGMRVGGIRNLAIPPEMGYGSAGAGNIIPPNATLLFQVELLGVGK